MKVSDVLKFESIDICDKCGSGNVEVYDSRMQDSIRIRRRKCLMCGYKYNTCEIRQEDVEKLQYCDNCKEQLIDIGNEINTIINQLKVSDKNDD